MITKDASSRKTGLLMFLGALALGLVIFFGFGYLAGTFSSGRGLVDSLTGSLPGWVALFGATLIIGSPIIGFTIWAVDRLMKSMTDQQ